MMMVMMMIDDGGDEARTSRTREFKLPHPTQQINPASRNATILFPKVWNW